MRGRKVILLVSADQRARVRHQIVLKREGYAVLEAESASEALGIVREQGPDLVVTAMKPGQEVGAALIRALREAAAGLPILALGDEASRAEAEAAGATWYEKLPITSDALTRAVAQLLGR